MPYEFIRVDLEENIGTITLARPERRNVLMEEVRLELLDAFDRLEKDAEARAIILTGGPDIFAAGANIKAMAEASPMEMYHRKRLPELCRKIEAIPKPVIAAVAGYCLGGGCEIVLACDLRVAADNLRIGLPEVNIGIIPAGAATSAGESRRQGAAKETHLHRDFISAEEAMRIGLVNRVVPKNNLCRRRGTCQAVHPSQPAFPCHGEGRHQHRGGNRSRIRALARGPGFLHDVFHGRPERGMRAFLEEAEPVYEGRKED
jgi:enoyl-CoA hydratase